MDTLAAVRMRPFHAILVEGKGSNMVIILLSNAFMCNCYCLVIKLYKVVLAFKFGWHSGVCAVQVKCKANRPLSIYWNSAWQWGLEDTNKGNRVTMFIHFLCLCPLGLTIKLNFNMSKVAYWQYSCCAVDFWMFWERFTLIARVIYFPAKCLLTQVSVFHTKFNIPFRRLVLLEMIFFLEYI